MGVAGMPHERPHSGQASSPTGNEAPSPHEQSVCNWPGDTSDGAGCKPDNQPWGAPIPEVQRERCGQAAVARKTYRFMLKK